MDVTLKKERDSADIAPEALKCILYGGQAGAERRTRLLNIWYNDPEVRSLPKLTAPFLSRTQQYERGIKLGRRLQELRQIHKLSPAEFTQLIQLSSEESAMSLNDTVYVGSMRTLTSPAQRATLLPRAQLIADFGCYVQTEVSHGSAVRNIETTATYLPASDEFDLHTPSPSATKWWVGALGRTASNAVVVARLLLPQDNGSLTDYGPQPFLLPIREPGTHKPTKGLTIGDIGPKVGFNPVDNGWMRFDHVRIPRTAFLGAAGSVERQPVAGAPGKYRGVFVPPAHPQAAYAGMTAVRVGIIAGVYFALAQAATISVRYSAVRRQFPPPGAPASAAELQIIDYSSQQRKVLPGLAMAYCFKLVGDQTQAVFEDLREAVARDDTSAVNNLHTLSSALKVFLTDIGWASLESMRRACGGHGYSAACGIGRVTNTFIHLNTAEGENTVLSQQVARHLLKLRRNVLMGAAEATDAASASPSSFTSTSSSYSPRSKSILPPSSPALRWVADLLQAAVADGGPSLPVRVEDLTKDDGLIAVHAMLALTRHYLSLCTARLSEDASNPAAGWNACLPHILAMCRAFGSAAAISATNVQLAVIRSQQQQQRPGNRPAMTALAQVTQLRDLMALFFAEDQLAGLLQAGVLTVVESVRLNDALSAACARVRRTAVALVDGFDLPDALLGSALGRYDGQYVQALLEWVKHEPLNQAATVDIGRSDIARMRAIGEQLVKASAETRAKM